MIDEEATLKQFGYRSSELTQCSKKWIVVNCPRCKKARICQYCNYLLFKNSDWCKECRKFLNPTVELNDPEYQYKLSQTFINEEKTKKEFGYYSIDLSPNSKYKVYAICRNCGKERLLPLTTYTNTSGACRKCARDHTWLLKRGPFNIEYFYAVWDSINNSNINELKTFEEFGYYSTDLLNKSTLKIYINCPTCNCERIMRYVGYLASNGRCIKCIDRTIVSIQTRKKISTTKRGISINEWKEFSTPYSHPAEFNEKLKIKVRNNANNRCEMCNKIEKKKALAVHHIDRDKNNNTMENLVAVCASCHGKIHNAVTTSHLQYIKSLEDYIWN